MSPGGDEHDWARVRFAAYAAGLLERAAASRLERHATHCDTCRGELAGLLAPDADRGRHIPDALISRWPRAMSELRGLQRELVRRHLVQCQECRTVLRQMGQVAELPRVPELEPTHGVLEMLDGLADPVGKGGPERIPESNPDPTAAGAAGAPGRRRWLRKLLLGDAEGTWRSWVFGGVVGAAAASLALLVFLPHINDGEWSGVALRSLLPHTGAQSSATSTGVVLETRPLRLSPASRGSQAQTPVARVPAGTRELLLAMPPLYLEDTTTVHVRVTDPAGRILGEVVATASELETGTLRVGDGAAAISAGRYVLSLRTSKVDLALPFRVVVSAGH